MIKGLSGMTTCTIGSPTCTGMPVNGSAESKRFAEVMSTKLGNTEALGFEVSAAASKSQGQTR